MFWTRCAGQNHPNPFSRPGIGYNKRRGFMGKRQRSYEIREKAAIQRMKGRKITFLLDYLLQHPCIDCGETDIRVFDFDHKDRSTKKEGVGNLMRGGRSIDLVIEEVSKCEVRCANCHRKKTQDEIKSWKSRIHAIMSGEINGRLPNVETICSVFGQWAIVCPKYGQIPSCTKDEQNP